MKWLTRLFGKLKSLVMGETPAAKAASGGEGPETKPEAARRVGTVGARPRAGSPG